MSSVQCVDIASILRLQNEVNKQSKSEEKLEKGYLRREVQGKGKYSDLSLKKKKRGLGELSPVNIWYHFLKRSSSVIMAPT